MGQVIPPNLFPFIYIHFPTHPKNKLKDYLIKNDEIIQNL